MSTLSGWLACLGELFYPPYCEGCGVSTSCVLFRGAGGGLSGVLPGSDGDACKLGLAGGTMLCEACSAGVVPLSRHEGMACLRCSKVFAGGVRGWGTCASCMEGRPAFDCAVAAYPARGLVREMVHRFKYEGRKELCWLLAGWMGEGLEDPRLRDPPPEVLVPVPLHWFRQWSRGFNQAELLARSLSEGLTQGRGGSAGAFPVELLLRRGRRTGTQTRLDRQGRLGNIQGAFELRRGAARRLQGRRVLLVDDVLTTGATLDACARVLLSGGAASVRALAVARG